jgi:transcription termination factor Rho
MTPEQQIERSVLAGKDRDELHTIAGAVGVKSATRMRKADLIEAILVATNGTDAPATPAKSASATGNGDAPKPRRAVRSVRASQLDDDDPIAALAAEEDSLAAEPDETPAPSPRRSRTTSASATAPTATATNGDHAETASTGADGASDADGATASTTTSSRPSGSEASGAQSSESRSSEARTDNTAPSNGGDTRVDPEDERQSFGDGNRRGRRRRRGRGAGQEQGGPNEPRQSGGGGGGEFQGEPIEVRGMLDLRDEGYGFLRAGGYLPANKDVYVSASQVRRFALRKGDDVKGTSRPQASNEKYPALLRVDEINGMTPDDARARPRFEDLTPLFPDSRLRLEMADNPHEITGRIVDLVSPIGKGQRGLIVSPPKAGKTTILKQLVYAIERNNPEVHLMVLLVDERPEEVTDMRRHVLRGEVVASTFDRPADEHTQVAELAIERAKRLVEMGTDVVIVLDGITRLARAYNLAAPTSGRVMSGGVDSTALYPPKKFFGAARNIEEGGSLTIVATALVDTGSRMDEVIFEEFKGTGNMELRLDRRLSERRIYPSIDVEASSTRHEELLFDRQQLQQVWKLRRVLNALEDGKGLELLIDKIRTTKSNDEFLGEIAKAPTPGG